MSEETYTKILKDTLVGLKIIDAGYSQGYGYISLDDGRKIYLSRSEVSNII